MPKVLISDKLSPAAVAIFAERGVEADLRPGLSPEELKAALPGYDGLAIRSATKVTADIIAAADGLKVVGRAGIGVDNVDIAAATAKGIAVMNTPFGNAITTAEHTIAMMLSLARQIPQADASTQAGKWEKSRFMGVELTGKTLGVIGCGNIGSIVADRARGLKMRVVAYDPFLSNDRAVSLGVEKVELDELFARADVVTLHVPNTEATRHMIDAAAIAKMKRGVRILNCARGGLVVEEDLRAALDAGQVAGAAFDVFAVEPAKASPLFGHPAVVCTPHLGASTAEAQENVALQIAEQMSDYLLTGAVSNALNMPSVTAEEAPKLRPYLHLAEQLGSFAGQITESAIKSATFEFQGEVAELNCRPITAVALTGVLTPLLRALRRLSHPDPRDPGDGTADAQRCRYPIRRREAAHRGDRGRAAGGGGDGSHAVRPQPGQARPDRRPRHRARRCRRQHRQLPPGATHRGGRRSRAGGRRRGAAGRSADQGQRPAERALCQGAAILGRLCGDHLRPCR